MVFVISNFIDYYFNLLSSARIHWLTYRYPACINSKVLFELSNNYFKSDVRIRISYSTSGRRRTIFKPVQLSQRINEYCPCPLCTCHFISRHSYVCSPYSPKNPCSTQSTIAHVDHLVSRLLTTELQIFCLFGKPPWQLNTIF